MMSICSVFNRSIPNDIERFNGCKCGMECMEMDDLPERILLNYNNESKEK